MNKKLLVLPLMLSALTMNAEANYKNHSENDEKEITRLATPLKPTYLDDAIGTNGWGGNWFVEVKGGASSFAGTPVGCGDFFNRVMPILSVGAGKWFTPAVGARLGYQGLKFKNANLNSMKYHHIHADLMVNLTPNLQVNEYGLSKFDVIPFVGFGYMNNTSVDKNYLQAGGVSTYNKPFAFNYGVELRYRLVDRLHLLAEVSGVSTLGHFDGVGASHKLGDNMVNVSVGLSFTFGKRGWKRVVDAQPYIHQNNYLMENYVYPSADGSRTQSTVVTLGNNNYSGLVSLRERLGHGLPTDSASLMSGQGVDGMGQGAYGANGANNGKNGAYKTGFGYSTYGMAGAGQGFAQGSDMIGDSAMVAVGVPVHFYFKKNTATLVNKTQLANLKEIAAFARDNKLYVQISAAADSATGVAEHNKKLAKKRGEYIVSELEKFGVSKEYMRGNVLGGINMYSPNEANRATFILLTVQP